VLRFGRDAIVVESNSQFQIYPATAMRAEDTMVLAEIIDQAIDAEVEHTLPIRAHTTTLNLPQLTQDTAVCVPYH